MRAFGGDYVANRFTNAFQIESRTCPANWEYVLIALFASVVAQWRLVWSYCVDPKDVPMPARDAPSPVVSRASTRLNSFTELYWTVHICCLVQRSCEDVEGSQAKAEFYDDLWSGAECITVIALGCGEAKVHICLECIRTICRIIDLTLFSASPYGSQACLAVARA